MRKTILTITALSLAAAIAPAPSSAADDAKGFTTLFNGKDLSGWRGESTIDPRKFEAMSKEEQDKKRAADAEDAAKHWSVDADKAEIVSDGHGVFLGTEKDYGDVELFVDYKLSPKGDSGIYLRGTPQVQIWDFTNQDAFKHGADKGSGGLWNNSPGAPGKDPLVLADNPIGDWNTLRIIQIGARTTVYLNGKLVVQDATMENYWNRALPLAVKGPIQLQTHGSETRFRNIKVREIPAEEANAYLANLDGGTAGFASLFNGKDLSGWAGAVDNYEAVDGTIRCKPKKGGVLYYDKKYGDFISRLEFRLPPAGNNGLAIRYPGTGNAAYNGMTEIQILDSEHPKYAKIDPRQAHGSAYGMVPAARGYLRPTGEWNYQETTVKGSKIKVELNGSIILDADLSEVKDYMDGSEHPGKNLEEGYFGFAGHNDPVEFRNIYIKPID